MTADYLHQFFFVYYTYICMTVFVLGSALRYDRDQYSWKADSSQLLRKKGMRIGNNLFHVIMSTCNMSYILNFTWKGCWEA